LSRNSSCAVAASVGWRALLLLLLGAGVSCAPQTTSSDDSSSEEDQQAVSCQNWQSMYCQLFAPCLGVDMSQCVDSVDDVVCADDAPFDRCQTELSSATCSTLPDDCHPLDMADPVDAFQKCEDFQAATCDLRVSCDPQVERAECRQELDAELDCHQVYAVQVPGYANCLKALSSTACSQTDLPTVCQGVLWVQ
jgi:hypothetical protein